MKVELGPYVEGDEERKIDIHIDDYDIWSMDHSLALIILPMLKLLKEKKRGTPHVDAEDVPEVLRDTEEETKQWVKDGTISDKFELRWDYVMNQMIWSFERIIDDSWKDQFLTGERDMVFTPVDSDGNEVPEEEATLFRWDKGPNDTSHFDVEGYKKYNEQIDVGLRMFGKYFRSLWD